MNTKIIYNLKIMVNNSGSVKGFTEHAKLETEVAYKELLQAIEQHRFITIMNTQQNLVTIKTDCIFKIETSIDVESDTIIEETEE